MVIASDNKLEINQIIQPAEGRWLSDNNAKIHYYGWSFRVIREATYDEWAKYSIENSLIELKLSDLYCDKGNYYYEVTMD